MSKNTESRIELTRESALKRAVELLGCRGYMLSFSKGAYSDKYPNNLVAFNDNLVVEGLGKVWYGDIDVTRSLAELKELARDFGKRVYVLKEMDARFENEASPLIENAIFSCAPTAKASSRPKRPTRPRKSQPRS